jgi:DNA-binding CsgD family transcriptional regulator
LYVPFCETFPVAAWGAVGRDEELDAVRALLDAVHVGTDGPAMLSFLGEAGIGKSTVWEAAVDEARERGFTVLSCRPSAAEVRSTFSGLVDLLAGQCPDGFDDLPKVQGRALDAALLRGPSDAVDADPRAVGLGFLAVLRDAAARGPVLLAIDDLHWLDQPTLDAVRYTVRRCPGALAVLVTWRVVDHSVPPADLVPLDESRARAMTLGPLTMGALHEVVTIRSGRAPPRPLMVRIARISAGNPFFAIELARAGGVDLPDTLRAAVGEQLTGLDTSTLEALVAVAAVGTAPLELLARVLTGDVAESLAGAERRDVVEFDHGAVRFTHPLLAEATYQDADPALRRDIHRRFAAVVDGVEERARHLALSSLTADAATIEALDDAASVARRRGSPIAAADLLEMAIGLGGDEPRRRVAAARHLIDAGQPARAESVLAPAWAALDAGPERADALCVLGVVRYQADDFAGSIELLEQAHEEAAGAPGLRADIAAEIVFPLTNSGRAADVIAYLESGIQDAASASKDARLGSLLCGLALQQFLRGAPLDDALIERAVALEDVDMPSHAMNWPATNAAILHLWAGRAEEALVELLALDRRCVERGEESDLEFINYYLVAAALALGDIATAAEHVAGGLERARITGTDLAFGTAQMTATAFHAWVGRAEEAREAAAESTQRFQAIGMPAAELFVLRAMGGLELSLGDAEAAATLLAPVAAAMASMDFHEPSAVPFLPDAAEALLAVGQRAEAESLVGMLEESGRTPDRAWARAVGARGRGLVRAAAGDLDEAESAFATALAAHNELPLRYDRGRTLLALGRLRRRRNDRRGARDALERAEADFVAVGAGNWAQNAADELARVSPRHRVKTDLTPTERQIAEMAGSGMTNREVAAALFVSPKTVEANLARAYQKLGIRSRAELGHWYAEQHEETST